MSKFNIKSIIGSLKQRWGLAAFIGVAAIVTPGLIYFATEMSGKKHAEFQKKIDEDANKFRATTIPYKVPAMLPGEKPIEVTAAPNEELIKAFKAARDAQAQQASGLVAAAVAANKLDHAPLIDALLPKPPEGDQVLAKQMARQCAGPVQQALLDAINAGPPMDAPTLAGMMKDQQFSILQRFLGNDANKDAMSKLTEDQQKTLQNDLLKFRVHQYRQRAQKVSVYATISCFANLAQPNENVTPTLGQVWDWQMVYWVQQDITRAIGRANTASKNLGVSASVVKRIHRIEVLPDVIPAAGNPAGGTPPPADDAPDYARSVTGRKGNSLYDVRNAMLTCVVATHEIPTLLNALSSTNLMSVIDVKMERVDPVAELREGYYYGDAHVTRLVLTIESLWLKEWTKQWTPADLAGTPVDPNAPAGDRGAPPPPPQPSGGSGRKAIGGG